MAKLERLATATIASTTASIAFTASSKTIVRTIDVVTSSTVDVSFGIGAADANNRETVGHFWWNNMGGTEYAQWTGGVVVNTGESVWVDATGANLAAYVISGVTNLL